MTWAWELAHGDKNITLCTKAQKELKAEERVFKVLCFKKTFEVLGILDVK